ncbi:MAG: tyrosine-type recombinase/integrase [Candidatus Acidiferrales bacterium]
MNLQPYRRHNPANCKSQDTIKCNDTKHPCPIWVSGTGPDGKFIRQSLRKVTGSITRDWKAATEAIREWEANGKTPKPAAGRATIKDLRDGFMGKVEGESLSNETLRKYRTMFDQLEAFCTNKGVKFADELDYQMLLDFRSSWSDGPLSTCKKLERLRGVMKYALRRKWVTENVAADIKPPKVEWTDQDGKKIKGSKPALPFSDDEMTAILADASELNKETGKRLYPRLREFILVMRYSGLRISDTAMLKIISLKDGKITLHQAKTGVAVAILMPPPVVEELNLMDPKSKKYFFWSGTSTPRTVVSVWERKLLELFKRADIVKGHSHRFRDTFAVKLFLAGVQLETVSRLLGHTSIRITEKHYNPWIKDRQDSLDAEVKRANGWHDLQKEPATILSIKRKQVRA